MAVIIDADVIIRGEKGTFDLGKWLRSNGTEQFQIAAITVAELWHGVERATAVHKSARASYLRALLDALPIIPYTEQTAYHHARIWAQLEEAGQMVGAYDAIVAATAIERDDTVATFNKKHFTSVLGLRVLEPK
jgi:tRNA(fMet)-specific endonuclease VapC